MPNQYVNKVQLGNEVLLDLTADTATAADVAEGKTFHDASGALVTGTASGGGGTRYTAVIDTNEYGDDAVFLTVNDGGFLIQSLESQYPEGTVVCVQNPYGILDELGIRVLIDGGSEEEDEVIAWNISSDSSVMAFIMPSADVLITP